MTGSSSYTPKVRHESLSEITRDGVTIGHVYRVRRGGWYAHPIAETTDYSWGPCLDRESAERVLRRMPT